MTKVTLKIEIIVDECNAENLAHDFQQVFWKYKLPLYRYKYTIEKIPISFCKACGDPIFKETSNSLCEDSVCTRIRQIKFNEKKDIELKAWKEVMCDQCTEDDDTCYCYRNDNLINESKTCEGCIYNTRYGE